jgi:AmiR/NasT family two-component response regulator
MQTDDENIIELLGPRRVIGQAIDLLMASRHVSRDAAFEILVQRSSGSHRKVRDVAAAVVRDEDD